MKVKFFLLIILEKIAMKIFINKQIIDDITKDLKDYKKLQRQAISEVRY